MSLLRVRTSVWASAAHVHRMQMLLDDVRYGSMEPALGILSELVASARRLYQVLKLSAQFDSMCSALTGT